MKPLYLCVPVIKRYDLLRDMLLSLDRSTVKPDLVYIIDNGRNSERVSMAMSYTLSKVFTPDKPMGLAESWNWFITHVPEERLIVNDDLTFAPNDLEMIVNTPGDFVSALAGSNACSCFLLRDSCVEKVGLFDETISPGYAYYEDCDYVERMVQKKVRITAVSSGVVHVGSATLAKASESERMEHNRRFMIAQENFVKKWGRMPDLSRPGLYDD